MSDACKISFGIIVLNGEPFTRYCLRSLYAHAHEILVVEGAVCSAAKFATPDGHSTDETVATIRRFQEEEDPDCKVRLILRSGFWSEKDEQSAAYAEAATGNYLWQIDIDEFYRQKDILRVLELLHEDGGISGMSFKQVSFWGGFDTTTDGWYLRRGADICHRLFKWRPEYCYVAHRPPTVVDCNGVNLRGKNWIGADDLCDQGIFLYHYSLMFPHQVRQKSEYYAGAAWARRAKSRNWAEDAFVSLGRPFHVHNVSAYPSWLERFEGTHPEMIQQLAEDIRAGEVELVQRQCADIKHLVKSNPYRLKRQLLRSLARYYSSVYRVARWPFERELGLPTSASPDREHSPETTKKASSLQILHINTFDYWGGAERVARDLVQRCRSRGCGARLIVGYKLGSDIDVECITKHTRSNSWTNFWSEAGNLAMRRLRRVRGVASAARWCSRLGEPQALIDIYKGMENFNFNGTWQLLSSLSTPSLLHCHNLHGEYFDLRTLPWLSKQMPVVVTLHDAWLLSGHCAYPLDCDRWLSGCGSCPYPKTYPAVHRDATAYNWERKRSIYARSRLYIATPSNWLMEKVNSSILSEGIAGKRVIPNGVDLTIFRPDRERNFRKKLRMGDDDFVILHCGSHFRSNPWKDFDTVRKSIAMMSKKTVGRRVVFVIVGDASVSEDVGYADVRYVSYQREPRSVARYFQLADVTVHAAKVESETHPMVIMESMACGVPVVATAVGGVPEIVSGFRGDSDDEMMRHLNPHDLSQSTGRLVPPGDHLRMAEALLDLAQRPQERRQMGDNAARLAKLSFGADLQTSRYLDFYKVAMDDWSKRRYRGNQTCTP